MKVLVGLVAGQLPAYRLLMVCGSMTAPEA